ncbi:MAG: methyltransferase domain-containing protein [Allosphingosinicella sp.]
MPPPLGPAEVAAARGPWAGREGQLDAPFWPTPAPLVEAMLDLAEVGPDDFLIDLGCGDGRIAIAAAARGARAVGSDLDADRIAEAKAAALAAGCADRAEFRQEDVFATDLASASVVALYLVPHLHTLLHGRLLDQLRPGTRVVAHAFGIGDWAPEKQAIVEGRRIYLWRIPGGEPEEEDRPCARSF